MLKLFTRKKTHASILNSFGKTIDALEKLVVDNTVAAGAKSDQIEKLQAERRELDDDIKASMATAKKLRALTGIEF